MSREEKAASRRTRLSGSGRVRALLSLGMVLGLGTVGTLAVWSSNAEATTGIFSTGSIDLKLDESDGPTANPYAFTALKMSTMIPGRSVAAVLPVQNRGSVKFDYSATAKAVAESTVAGGIGNADVLARNLEITVHPGGTVSGPATKQVCSDTAIATKPLSTAAAPMAAFPLITTRGPLVSGADENICFQVKFKQPAAGTYAPAAAQSAKLHVDFVFTADAVT